MDGLTENGDRISRAIRTARQCGAAAPTCLAVVVSLAERYVVITRRKFLQRSSLLATTLAAGNSGLLNAVAQTHAVATMAPALDVNTLAAICGSASDS